MITRTHNSVGWDIGGAHLKAVTINTAGEVSGVFQQPCPLWKGLDQLRNAASTIMQQLDATTPTQHAITMTGELVDLFTNRDDGVKHIINTFNALISNTELLVFAGSAGFIPAQHCTAQHYQDIASSNWLASATFAAQCIDNGLFVDIGSTTTDILLLQDQQVLTQGSTDYQRLCSQELIYTGIIRTAVMAVTRHAQDEGQTVGLMAEYFATMADVYRLTYELNENDDQTDTADGAEKTITASARRLARMIGCDFHPAALPRWQRFAENIRHQQLQFLQTGCQIQLQRSLSSTRVPLIGAGVGRFLVQTIALNLGHPYVDFASLLPNTANQTQRNAADCAPALAVAYLARQYPLFTTQ
ncbi:hydantoinase/oxoprolinase family protein [Crenothrix polyspora]|uniref:H4MPT-linked C1 transfer pathway protein n=1 Tax=Crenothrix polyspora TaxID=360316 RepID=A0A1R4H284_9GAMM|nr:hydantoinase/oxoprolinase family protein [Crenothrix polyspora]SJM90286.1 H4MPT-linked C1 transfer pathway protein [Crenothrix polyspora]